MKEYNVDMMTWSSMNKNSREDNDTETFNSESCSNYRDAVKRAKELSKHIGEVMNGTELVDVCITCADNTCDEDEGCYSELWWEYYKDGKKDFRVMND